MSTTSIASVAASVPAAIAGKPKVPTKSPAASPASATPKGASAAAPRATPTAAVTSAARVALTEANETPAQTAQEARGGDPVAQRLLQRQSARSSSATAAVESKPNRIQAAYAAASGAGSAVSAKA